ncbi:MAG: hypothetical protein IJ105_02450 [Bacilli bacterium]|nr:hypothetical protein [Bacilli bacterium]
MRGNSKSVALAVLGVILVGMTIAYAALQTNLSISGSVQSPSVSWDVHIINFAKGTVVGSATGPTAEELTTGGHLNATAISDVAVNLPKPGDSITYSWDIVNAGTIDAKLTSAPTGGIRCTDGKNCNDITYNLACDTAASTANNVLYATNDGDTDTAHCTLVISRAAATVSQDANQTYTSNDGAGTFNMAWTYVQN